MTPASRDALMASAPRVGPTRRLEMSFELEGQRTALDEGGEVLGLGQGEVTGDLGAAALDADVAAHTLVDLRAR